MWEIILDICLAVLSITLAGITYYVDTKNRIQDKINGEIAKAEGTGEVGAVKMAYVVENIYKIVPKIMRPIFTKKVIEKIAQKAFDKIEEYAEKRAKEDING